jgi:prepilin-type N-terminal cleavage/methylation domain-containing protein
MTLATGNRRHSPARGGGFTLIEILLVIALISVAVSVVLINFTAFADRDETNTPEEVLTAAVRKARFIAAADRITTTLRYNEERGTLQIEPSGEELEINADFGPDGRGEIRFFLVPSAEGMAPFPDPQRSTLRAPAVAFAPDRSSSPFLAEIDSGRGSAVRLRYDPFSSVIRTEE